MLHRNARRGFAVEIKSTGRRGAASIPAREPKPARMRTKPLVQQSVETPSEDLPRVKPAQNGRVLPNLIVPEAPETSIEAAPPEPKTRRPYTRRAKPVPAAVIEAHAPMIEPNADAAMLPAAPSLVTPPSDRKGGSARNAGRPLALGQRWKQRLSRWSR